MILYTANRIDAHEAERIGLINKAVADEDLNEAVLEIARTIADNAPLSVAASKLTINEVMKDPNERDMEAVRRAGAVAFDSDDYKEGRTAFMEKRRPKSPGAVGRSRQPAIPSSFRRTRKSSECGGGAGMDTRLRGV